MNRRRFLTGSVGGMLCLTGCLQSGGGDESGEPTGTPAETDTGTATPQSPFPSDSCLAAMTENVPDPLYGFEFSAGSSPEVGGVTAATSGSATVGDGIATFPQAGGEIRVTDVRAIDDMTVSLFARPAVAATDQWNVILWYSPPDVQWSGWGVEHGQGAVDFWVEGPEEASTEVLTESSSPLPTGTWTHIMGVKRGTTTTLYVDGQQVATSEFPSGSISYGDADSVDMVLGRHAGSGSGNRYYQGDLDSVAIWDQALSTDQIDTLLATGSSCR